MNSDSKVVWLVGFSHFITHGYMTILPAVLIAIASEQSMSFVELGIIANIGYFLYGLGAFPAGYLADRFGSKRLLSVGILGMAASSLLVGMTSSMYAFGFAYGLLGIFASIHHPAGLSLIARRITSNKGRAMGFHGVLGNVGLFLSPLVAASGMMLFGTWRAAYLSYGVIGIFFFVLLFRAKIPGEKDFFQGVEQRVSGSQERVAKHKEDGSSTEENAQQPAFFISVALLLLFVGSILSGFIFRGSLTFLPALFQQNVTVIANHDEPMVMAGYAATAVLSLGLIGAWLGGYINDKIKYPELVPACIFLVVSPALFFASRFLDNQLLLVTGLFSLIYYAWQPSQNFLIARYTRKSSHGIGFGVNFFLIFGMGSLATTSGGWVADHYGVDRFYAIMAGVGFAASLAALAIFPLRKYLLQRGAALTNWKLVKEKTGE